MKKLLLASCLVLAGLWPAKADQLPKDFIGTWCFAGRMRNEDGKHIGNYFERDKGECFTEERKEIHWDWTIQITKKGIQLPTENCVFVASRSEKPLHTLKYFVGRKESHPLKCLTFFGTMTKTL